MNKPVMDKEKAVQAAMSQIERQFGKGAVMKLGSNYIIDIPAIPTGSIALDQALGVGGLPRGRITEIYGPEASGKTRWRFMQWPRPRNRVVLPRL